MHDGSARRLGLLACLLGGLGAAAPAAAQPAQTAPARAQLIPYADPAFGFELKVPAGWTYDRTRFQEFEDSIGLLRGTAPGGREALQILVFRSFPMKPFEDWIVDFGKALAQTSDSKGVKWETVQLPPRAGAVLTFSSKLGADTLRSHCLCVPFDPNTVWVLVYSATVFGEQEAQRARALFDELTASLRVLYDPAEAERLAPALDRGKALLARLRARAGQVEIDDAPYTYEISVAGKPIGYLLRRISREEYVFSGPRARRRYAKDGLRVRERSWRFDDDGTVRFSRLDLFSSFDLRSELIEYQQTQLPAPDVQPQTPLVKVDQVIREDDVLFSSYTTSLDRTLPDPAKPISVGPVYLDLAWVRLLPGLLAGEPPEPHTVAIYNTETRALLAHTVTPCGPQDLPGHTGPVLAFETRDGFIDRPSRLYTDSRGTLLRLEAGDLLLTRVPAAEIERKYGPRRDAARARFGLRED